MPESSQTTRPTVSVVIPTLNREAMLCHTIETLLGRETYSPYELIVVDQTEQHEEATNRYLESVRSRFVHRRVTYKSLPRARNDGSMSSAAVAAAGQPGQAKQPLASRGSIAALAGLPVAPAAGVRGPVR